MEIRDCGLRAASVFPLKELKDVNFPLKELKAEGFELKELKPFYPLHELRNVGFTLSELQAAGFTKAQLKNGGFTALEFRVLNVNVNELKAAGFNATDLRAGGYKASELKQASFSPAEVRLRTTHGTCARRLCSHGVPVSNSFVAAAIRRSSSTRRPCQPRSCVLAASRLRKYAAACRAPHSHFGYALFANVRPSECVRSSLVVAIRRATSRTRGTLSRRCASPASA